VIRAASREPRAAIHEFGKVDTAECAGLKGQQRLFAAGVGRFYFAQRRGWIVAIDSVDEYYAWLTGLMSTPDEHFPDVSDRVESA
jgi:hypothetical protein